MSTSVTSVIVSTTDSDSGSKATEILAPNLGELYTCDFKNLIEHIYCVHVPDLGLPETL